MPKLDSQSQNVNHSDLNQKISNWSVNGTWFEPTDSQHKIEDGKQVKEEATERNQ